MTMTTRRLLPVIEPGWVDVIRYDRQASPPISCCCLFCSAFGVACFAVFFGRCFTRIRYTFDCLFKLALMGFHLSWMPYTFKICVYPVYSWARGVYTLGTGLGWGCHMVIQLVGIGLFWGHSISIIVQMYHLPADRWDSQSIGSISISWSPFVFLFAFAKPCPRTI